MIMKANYLIVWIFFVFLVFNSKNKHVSAAKRFKEGKKIEVIWM